MMTSGGGGYCDCGDPEAWKQHPCCELHMPKQKDQNSSSSSDYISKLPKDIEQRATQLFSFLFDYIFEKYWFRILTSNLPYIFIPFPSKPFPQKLSEDNFIRGLSPVLNKFFWSNS